MIPHPARPILQAEDLSQPHLPRRISFENSFLPEEKQQVRLAHHALADLRVDQVLADVRRREFGGLRHFGQRLCEVHEGLATVGGVEEQDGDVWAAAGAVA